MHDHPVYAKFYTILLIKIAQRKREWVCTVQTNGTFVIYSNHFICSYKMYVIQICSHVFIFERENKLNVSGIITFGSIAEN